MLMRILSLKKQDYIRINLLHSIIKNYRINQRKNLLIARTFFIYKEKVKRIENKRC